MARDRWEFCYVFRGNKEVHYFTIPGDRKEKVRDSWQAIAELGQQGWDLVGSDGTSNDRDEEAGHRHEDRHRARVWPGSFDQDRSHAMKDVDRGREFTLGMTGSPRRSLPGRGSNQSPSLSLDGVAAETVGRVRASSGMREALGLGHCACLRHGEERLRSRPRRHESGSWSWTQLPGLGRVFEPSPPSHEAAAGRSVL